jgi:transposase
MKLHRNAALSWRGRQRLAKRVVVQGWTLAAAAEAAGVSVRCARKWAGRYRLEGAAGLLDRSSAPRRVANRTPVERVEVIVALRGLRFTAAEIAETLVMALSTVSGILARLGLGRLGRIGLEGAPLRALAPGRARARRRQAPRPHPGRGRQARPRRPAQALQSHAHRPRGSPPADRWLGVRAHRDRRPQPPRLRRGAARREGCDCDRLPAPRARLLCPLRDQGRAALDRQRFRLRLRSPRARLPHARHPPSAHPSLSAADERQSRALHPHAARRLGLRRRLRLKR